MCIFLFPALICIYSENLKVLPVAIQKLLAFDKFRFLTFNMLTATPPKVIRHKFPLRSSIPENFKSLASAVQRLRLQKIGVEKKNFWGEQINFFLESGGAFGVS